MPDLPDLYDLLGLNFDSCPSERQVRRAYLWACQHVQPNEGGLQHVFLKIKHAYNVLSDPNRRAQYDEYYRARRDERCMTMPEPQTFPPPPSPENVTQSTPSGPPIDIPDFSRPRPIDYSILPGVFRPDPIVEAYKQANFYDLEAVRHIDFLAGMDHDDFKPYMVDFLNFAAFAGMKRYHSASFQGRVEQRCHAIGSGMKPVSWAEAGNGIKDALQQGQALRIGVIMVVLRARAHLLFPADPFMKEVLRIVTSLGYLLESLKKLRQRFEGIGPGRWDAQNDALVLGAIRAHLDTARDMALVLERMKGLADDLALVGDDRPKRVILLTWICGEMTNWPRMSG
ncbi:hypothetical protein diail_6665 [Diaporthe ilicicola]|nr:hypothetical protein diail_6665 [Diaporthe ilicicola]